MVGGDVGSFSAFMAQAGRLVVCGNAAEGLGDSLYEAVLYVRGDIRSLGADAELQPMTADDIAAVNTLLAAGKLPPDPRLKLTATDYASQLALAQRLAAGLDRSATALLTARSLRA